MKIKANAREVIDIINKRANYAHNCIRLDLLQHENEIIKAIINGRWNIV